MSEVHHRYSAPIDAYRADGRYPRNGPIEIRVTGLDRPAEGVSGAGRVLPP